MHRRTASAKNSSSGSTILPLVVATHTLPLKNKSSSRGGGQIAESSSSPSSSPVRRRRKRLRPTSNYYYTANDWVSPDKSTVTKLAIVAAVAFCSVHLYLFHIYLSNHHHSSRSSASDDSLHRRKEPQAVTAAAAAVVVDGDAAFSIRPLRVPIDYTHYTIRINTWKRLETLRLSLEHHVTCPAVAQIQVVWCTAQGQPPEWLLQYNEQHGWKEKVVVVEQHDINSLNERFHVLSPGDIINTTTTTTTTTVTAMSTTDTPTMGILSLDDDLLRPCIAYDVAFWKWTQHPERMVGFDARSHEIVADDEHNAVPNNNNEKWKYAYKSTTERTNRYSLTLTRCSFVHVDYLHYYMHSPALAPIRQFVQDHLNCEDIAMSFMVSSLTQGQAPLLAPYWGVSSMIKLDEGDNKISATSDHKQIRDECVNQFAEMLWLKEAVSDEGHTNNNENWTPLQTAKLKHSSWFEYGAPAETSRQPVVAGLQIPDYLEQSLAREDQWKADPTTKLILKELADLRVEASQAAYEAGLVQGTEPWKDRFKRGDNGEAN